MLRYSENARNHIQDGVKKYSRIVSQARHRGMNERDTSDIVKAMLGDMLGYDPFFDVTADASVRGPNADHAVLIDGQLKFLLVVKSIGVVPHAAHLLRLSGANTPQYCQWAVLTNADVWACYRLGVGHDRHPELIFRVSLLDSKTPEEKTALFFLLSKEGVEQNALAQYWERIRALNPGRIASLLLSEEILNLLRRELLRTANFRTDRQALLDLLLHEVIRPEALAARSGPEGLPRLPQCYAYVANPNDDATWRLPYRNPDGSPNPEMLITAAGDISADARSLHIPADDVPLVKQRLRQAYLELGVAVEDLPGTLRL
jgi:hypothetical protein